MSGAQETARYVVRHETEYAYAAEVSHAHQLLHLTPRLLASQVCASHALRIEPMPTYRSDAVDSFGNPVVRVEFDQPHRHLLVTADMRVTITAPMTVNARESLAWNKVRDLMTYTARPRSPQDIDAGQFRMESPHVRLKRRIIEFSRDCFAPNEPVLVCADLLLAKLHRELKYAPSETHIGTSVMELLETRRGVCQDFAHLMIACCRAQGLAARYVSGYLRTTPAPGTEKLVGADASHAWVSVYAPPFGWVDFDPTNGVRVGTDHITLAWGRDFGDVSPLRGVIVGGGSHQLSVRVTVTDET
ncbi:MAG TPA: transglutaminase family protein [Steroidobacteraceae bacterium]|nr:transglutaminase family protein [Steroidobacteraceae bacterium]